MHAERDFLGKRVFPQLSEWCADRKLNLIDIDLRWGVTEADATKNKRVIEVCLKSIDKCRPFFLCFMGQRRGWVPDPAKGEIGKETMEIFPLLKNHIGESVTEMEITHALIDPLHNGTFFDEEHTAHDGSAIEYAFFYQRNKSYLKDISFADTKAIYENDNDKPKWNELKIPEDKTPLLYYASWNKDRRTPEIALPLKLFTIAEPNTPEWREAHRLWAERWNKAGIKVNEDGAVSNEMLKKAEDYNKKLTSGRLDNFRDDSHRPLSNIIFNQLKEAIAIRYDVSEEIPVLTQQERELTQQEQFLRRATQGYEPVERSYDNLDKYVSSGQTEIFAVTGKTGSGKTSYLAHWIKNNSQKNSLCVIYRFIGGSENSCTEDGLIRSIMQEIRERFDLQQNIPLKTTEMMDAFSAFLEQAGRVKKTVVIIDALNQLQSGLLGLDWIPAQMPKNTKLVISLQSGNTRADDFIRKKDNWFFYHVNPDGISVPMRNRMIRSYFNQYLKNLDQDVIGTIANLKGAENPLFLRIIISELRLFGSYSNLRDFVLKTFGYQPETAFSAVLKRIEEDSIDFPVPLDILLPHVLAWVAHSRYGLSCNELVKLLLEGKLVEEKDHPADAVNIILRQLKAYLSKQEGRVYFLFEALKNAVITRYTDTDIHSEARSGIEWHKELSVFFESQELTNPHRLNEQVWQYHKAKDYDAFRKTIWNFGFMQQRIRLCGVRSMLDDLELRMEHTDMPDEALRTMGYLSQALLGAAECVTDDIKQLPFQLCGRLEALRADYKEIASFIDSLYKKNFFNKPCIDYTWLRPCTSCLPVPGSVEGVQIADIEDKNGIVSEISTDSHGSVLVVNYHESFEVFNTRTLKSILQEDHKVSTLSVSASGQYLTICYGDGRTVIINLYSRAVIFQTTIDNDVVSIAVTNDARVMLFILHPDKNNNEQQLVFLNTETRQKTTALIQKGINNRILLSSDQIYAFVMESSKCSIWDVQSGTRKSEISDISGVMGFGIAHKQKTVYFLKKNRILSYAYETGVTKEIICEEEIIPSYYSIENATVFSIEENGEFAVVKAELPCVVDLTTGVITKRLLSDDKEFITAAMATNADVYFTVSYALGFKKGKILSWHPKNDVKFESSRWLIPNFRNLKVRDFFISSDGQTALFLRKTLDENGKGLLSVLDFSTNEPQAYNIPFANEGEETEVKVSACACKGNHIVLGTESGEVLVLNKIVSKQLSSAVMDVMTKGSKYIEPYDNILTGNNKYRSFKLNAGINRLLFCNQECYAALENGHIGVFFEILNDADIRAGTVPFASRKKNLWGKWQVKDKDLPALTDLAVIRYGQAILGILDGKKLRVIKLEKNENKVIYEYDFPESKYETYYRITGKSLDGGKILFSSGNSRYSASFLLDTSKFNISEVYIPGDTNWTFDIKNKKDYALYYNQCGRTTTNDLQYIAGTDMMNGNVPYSIVKEKSLPTYRYAAIFDATGGEIWQIPLKYGVYPDHCIISEDGKWVVTVNEETQIALWDFSNRALVTTMRWMHKIEIIDICSSVNCIFLIDEENQLVILSIEQNEINK
jgi:WD40 repeat protein